MSFYLRLRRHMVISLVNTKYVELCTNSRLSSGSHQMKENGRKEATQGFYTAVVKSSECKERLNVPTLHLLRKDTYRGPT